MWYIYYINCIRFCVSFFFEKRINGRALPFFYHNKKKTFLPRMFALLTIACRAMYWVPKPYIQLILYILSSLLTHEYLIKFCLLDSYKILFFFLSTSFSSSISWDGFELKIKTHPSVRVRLRIKRKVFDMYHL